MNKRNESTNIKEKLHNAGVSFKSTEDALQSNGKAFILYTIALFILLGLSAAAVFLAFNKGQERVLVPNVTGKTLTNALLEMQEKELYPRIQFRYSDLPGEFNQVLEQNPKAGTVVKAYRKVTLVVSRGVTVDYLGNYVGSSLDAVKAKFDALYAGAEIPLITIGNPTFKEDASPVGTILEQYPPEGTPVIQPVELDLIVSSGNIKPVTKVPNLIGKSLAEVLKEISKSKLVFDFVEHVASNAEEAGTLVKQSLVADSEVPEYTRILCDFAFPLPTNNETTDNTVQTFENRLEDEVADDKDIRNTQNYVHGIYKIDTVMYPYALPVKLEALPQEGASYTVATCNHVGGAITIPYAVPHGTTLVFSVMNQEKQRVEVQ